jgi:hypothetical protein
MTGSQKEIRRSSGRRSKHADRCDRCAVQGEERNEEEKKEEEEKEG